MAIGVQYHCPCLSTSPVPPPPHLPSSAHNFHPLHALYFCEECDAIRCNRCVTVEVSTYYCPNCLFEVPSASVRAEKNRCARNCFLCPNCRNTLSVVPSDPPDASDGKTPVAISTVGEPPFFLYCNHCRWDSADVGITFEKPTGLAAQLQKHEDSAPESLEFERLKEHFEPFIRASQLSSSTTSNHGVGGGGGGTTSSGTASSHHLHSSSLLTAASAALARDIPGVGKYNPYSRTGNVGRSSGKDKSLNKDEMPEYKSRLDIAAASRVGGGGSELDADFMRNLESIDEVAALEQRWTSSWVTPIQVDELKPLRVPLHSKRSKRCPACTHILIKPEQKAQSVRFKIKLVAANYLPAITVSLPHMQQQIVLTEQLRLKQTGKGPEDERPDSKGMIAGRSYPFQLSLTNPLYDPIQVRLSVQRVHVSTTPATGTSSIAAGERAQTPAPQEKSRRPPFAISLPTTTFPIAAFAEAWEYEDEEFGMEEDVDYAVAGKHGRGGEGGDAEAGGRDDGRGGRNRTVGVLEKKANMTTVGGEVVIGKEARGIIKFNMLVSYTYRSDDSVPSDGGDTDLPASSRGHGKPQHPEIKTFAFYTVVDLGLIIPREQEVVREVVREVAREEA